MRRNLFQIESVKVKTQIKVEQFNWFQRWVLKMIKVVIPAQYNVEFSIGLYKANFLKPGQVITLGNEASPHFHVLGKDLTEIAFPESTHSIASNRTMTLVEIKHQLSKTSGFIFASSCGESNYKRFQK